MFGATAASATSAEESRMDVWATTLSGRLFSLSSADPGTAPIETVLTGDPMYIILVAKPNEPKTSRV